MASPLPTPSRDPSSQTDHPLSISPGTAGISGMENYSEPENYFQPIHDNDTLNSEYASVTAPSTIDPQNPAPAEQPDSASPSPGITPQTLSVQTCSTSVTQCLSNITSSSLTTGIFSADHSDIDVRSSSPSYPLLLQTKSASKTPSPQLLLPALNGAPSPDIAENQVELDQSSEHALPSCSEALCENPEVTSYLKQQSDSELHGGSSEASEQGTDSNAIQSEAKELGKDIEQGTMDCISDDGLLPGDDPPLSNNRINPKVPVEEHVMSVNAQQTLTINTDPDQVQFEHCQPNPLDLKPSVQPTKPEATSRGAADCMPVVYLQVTKAVQEETQRATDTDQSQHPASTSRTSEALVLEDHVLKTVEKGVIQHLHGEQGHYVLNSNQKKPPVVLGSTTPEQRNSKNVPSTPTEIHQSMYPGLKTQQTHWAPHEAPGAHYNSYYGSFYPGHQNADHPYEYYSLPYSRAQHAWMGSSGHWPQMGTKAQLYDQNHQKEQHAQNQPEQSSSEHVHSNSNKLTSRQKTSKDRSGRVDQGKTSPYWSEYAKYYNSGGWNHQPYYSSAYYQDYYYPYDYGYQAEVSTSNSQHHNTKPDSYDDWWRYDPRYDSTFDHDHFSQSQQSYWDQCDRQSSHSGYSTQSMPSTRSQLSRISWHSEQSCGYPNMQYTDHTPYDVSIQSPAHSEDRGQLDRKTSNEAFYMSPSPKSSSNPEQFSFPHCCARFGPGGQLIEVLPNLPSEGKPALVQIHNTEMMLQGCWDQPELQSFPGPLTKDRTHKSEVLEFVRQKYQECLQNNTLADKEASCLIWELIELVCKQNGKLVGTDISHLLLGRQRSHTSSKKAATDLIDFTNEALSRSLENPACNAKSATEDFCTTPEDTERHIQRFRELLIFGKKKDALETAVSKGLWGHAFMLASKMDNRAYSQVMSKFIDSLPENDALRTFYQLISGRIPSSATHCGIKEWGDWCVHLAMVLSNHTRFKHLHEKTITRIGDTLASQGCSDAASFCYMVSQLDVDTQSDKSDIFLFGASSLHPLENATNEAIQRTELFEYALSLGSDSIYLPNFQIFKFIYACRLAERGLGTQSFQYCEVISKALLASASLQSLTLISQLIELSAKMRYFDQQLKDIPDLELSSEPEWLINLRRLHCQLIEEWNSPGAKKQETNLFPLLKENTDPKKAAIDSHKVSLLTTEIPNQTEGPPEVCLAPPAPQDILEKRALPKPCHVSDSGCFELGNKAVPLSTSSNQANPKRLPVEDPVQPLNPLTVPQSQLHILPSNAALLSGRLVHTKDAYHLSEDPSSETKESMPSLALPLHPLIALQPTSGQSQFTEALQSQSLNTDPKSTPLSVEPYILSSATLSYSTTESSPHIICPSIESHTLPITSSSSSKSLVTESGRVHELIAPCTDSSTMLSSSKSLTESESVPQLISTYTDPHKLPSIMLPSSMCVAKESELPQFIAQHKEHHTLDTTTLPSSITLTTESEPGPQLISPYAEPQTLPSTALPSSMSFATQSESVPQLTLPLPVPLSIDQMDQRQQATQPSVASPPMSSATQQWVSKNNLYSHEVQPVHVPSRSAPMLYPPLDPQPSDQVVSNERSQPTYNLESQTMPLLTVPLPTSHILPPSSNNYPAMQSQQVVPPQTPCLPADPMLGQKPSSLPSANPYAMGEKMAHSKQTHMPSKPLIPRLFVPQSPPPEPQPKKETGGGWFSWLFGKKKEANLPADTGKSLVWNENLQRWVDPHEQKNKSALERSTGVLQETTAEDSGNFDGPTAGLLSTMPALRPGPKRGYTAPLNPVLMSSNPGIQLYASAGISSSQAQMFRPANTYLTNHAISGQSVDEGHGHMTWTPNSQPVSYPQTSEDILQEIM